MVSRSQGMLGKVGRHTGRRGNAKSCGSGARFNQQRVGVAVVAAIELENLVATGVATGQTNSAHGGFCSGRDHADLFDVRVGVADHLGQGDLFLCRCTERGPAGGCLLDRLNDFGMAVAKNHRAPGADVVNVGVAVCIENLRPFGACNKDRVTTNRFEGSNRAVDAARDNIFCFGKEFRRLLMVHGGSLNYIGLVFGSVVGVLTEHINQKADRLLT